MSKIHYKHNPLTDYNYSFCDESDIEQNKENYNHNASPHSHLQIIEKIIIKQNRIHQQNHTLIQEQSNKIHKLQKRIAEICSIVQLSQCQHSQKTYTISPISQHESVNDSSIFQYSHNREKQRIQSKQFSKKSKRDDSVYHSNFRYSSNRIKSESSNTIREPSNVGLTKNARKKLLSTIASRKKNIQKQLRQRLSNHLGKSTSKPTISYLTYATQG